MKTTWVAGNKEEAEEITKAYQEGAFLRRKLAEMLEEKIRIKLRARTKEEVYTSPSWAYLQADAVGYTRALEEVISLIQES